MNDTTQQQIAQLESRIARQETQIRQLETEIAGLEQELARFQQQYDRIVKPASDRLDAVKAAIHDLRRFQQQRRMGYGRSQESLWQEKPPEKPFESFRYVPPPPDEPLTPIGRSDSGDDLKRLYRTLARRYHPDYALDDTDRAHRNQLMAMINDAYANHDMDALRALQDAPKHSPAAVTSSQIPLSILKLRQLQATSYELEGRIEDLKSERDMLLNSDMMDFKIEAKLARSQGRDLLREMAASLEHDYHMSMQELNHLRGQMF